MRTCHKRTVSNMLFFYCLSVRLTWPKEKKNQIQIMHVHLYHNHLTAQSGHGEKHVADLDKKY